MKKKIIAVSLIVAMMAVTIVGGTLAYFFDTDDATNVFTVGSVKIDLVEKTTDETGALVDYPEQPLQLVPGKEVTKLAWVANQDKDPAWVWVELWVPAGLDVPADAALNSFHFNYFGQFEKTTYDPNWASDYAKTPVEAGILNADHTPAIDGMVAVAEDTLWTWVDSYGEGADEVTYPLSKTVTETVDGVEVTTTYNVYLFAMEKPLAGNSISLPVLNKVYMDADVILCTDETCENGEACRVLKDGTHYAGAWELIVKAYAMQQDGFETVYEAIAEFPND